MKASIAIINVSLFFVIIIFYVCILNLDKRIDKLEDKFAIRKSQIIRTDTIINKTCTVDLDSIIENKTIIIEYKLAK